MFILTSAVHCPHPPPPLTRLHQPLSAGQTVCVCLSQIFLFLSFSLFLSSLLLLSPSLLLPSCVCVCVCLCNLGWLEISLKKKLCLSLSLCACACKCCAAQIKYGQCMYVWARPLRHHTKARQSARPPKLEYVI